MSEQSTIRNARPRLYYGAVSYVDDRSASLAPRPSAEDPGSDGDNHRLLLADHGDLLGSAGSGTMMTFFRGRCEISPDSSSQASPADSRRRAGWPELGWRNQEGKTVVRSSTCYADPR